MNKNSYAYWLKNVGNFVLRLVVLIALILPALPLDFARAEGEVPELYSPEDGAVFAVGSDIQFYIYYPYYETDYLISFSQDASFSTPVFEQTVTEGWILISPDLPAGIYYWRARAFNPELNAWSDWSAVRLIEIIAVNAFTSCDSVRGLSVSECEALVALYDATNGDNWNFKSGWKETDVPCTWYRVQCTDGHVTGLDIQGNNLSGNIPPEIGNLAYLRRLDLPDNHLTGSIPPEIGNLSQLEGLALCWNELSGDIPPTIANLVNLHELILYYNQLTWNEPIAWVNMSSLRQLDLSRNPLGGSIPESLTSSITIDSLNLRDNQLTTIPASIGNMKQLNELELAGNQFTGQIPSVLFGLTNLFSLDLSRNLFTGSIPVEFANYSQLDNLSLSGNQLTGSIPVELGNLTNLTSLELSQNLLTGNIPTELGNLTNLIMLNVESNPLMAGTLPMSLTNLVNLEGFLYANTGLCAPTNQPFQTWLAGIEGYLSPNTNCPIILDSDSDGINDDEDNAPDVYNPDQRDVDGDGVADVIDVCPNDIYDNCDTAGSTALAVGIEGGTLITQDQTVEMIVPEGALETNISLSITDQGGDIVLGTDQGELSAVTVLDVEPSGTIFSVPVTFNLYWMDTDDNGIVDGTEINESNLVVSKDGVVISGICGLDPGCDQVTNVFSFAVSGLSQFALGFINSAPGIESIQTNPAPEPVNTEIAAQLTFIDPDSGDLHTVEWDWGDGESSVGIVDEEGKTATGEHVYVSPGVYKLTATVTDSWGKSSSYEYLYKVIYDPEGGFVTGGGWFYSPAGSLASDASIEGKGSFGFISKYQKGANIPSGSTEFQFKAGNLNFNSTSYDWLVIAGAKAQYKGTGVINGSGEYKFILTAVDGQVPGGGGNDKIRIKIWDKYTDQLIYDNKIGSEDSELPSTELGGGSIVIHN